MENGGSGHKYSPVSERRKTATGDPASGHASHEEPTEGAVLYPWGWFCASVQSRELCKPPGHRRTGFLITQDVLIVF